MDANQLPKGQASEKSGDGRPENQPGIYRHKAAGVELITQPGADGVIQADALVRVGYERVGDVPSRLTLLEMQKAQLVKDKAEEAILKSDEDKLVAAIAAEKAAAEPVAEAAPAEPVTEPVAQPEQAK